MSAMGKAEETLQRQEKKIILKLIVAIKSEQENVYGRI